MKYTTHFFNIEAMLNLKWIFLKWYNIGSYIFELFQDKKDQCIDSIRSDIRKVTLHIHTDWLYGVEMSKMKNSESPIILTTKHTSFSKYFCCSTKNKLSQAFLKQTWICTFLISNITYPAFCPVLFEYWKESKVGESSIGFIIIVLLLHIY